MVTAFVGYAFGFIFGVLTGSFVVTILYRSISWVVDRIVGETN